MFPASTATRAISSRMYSAMNFPGTVAKTGEGVTLVKEGDQVAGVPLVPCMKCEDCQNGNYSLCKHYSFIGSRQYGSFAEYVVVPERNAVPFGEEVTF